VWELLRPIHGPVHVSIPVTSGRRPQRGIHLHRCPSLSALLITRRHDIPVTTIHRTIHDLDGCVPPRLVRRAIRQAEHKGLRLDGVESDRTRSDLEIAFLDLYRRHRLPLPEVNVKLGRWEVDFLWRDQHLVVEADSYLYHRGSVAFEDDHARDLDLRQLGFTVLRFTEAQLEHEPERVAADVAAALGR
jgi:very-short-patch-repair endonuclease